jgi:hypothetical protein
LGYTLTEIIKTTEPAQSILFSFSHALSSLLGCGTLTFQMIKTVAKHIGGI